MWAFSDKRKEKLIYRREVSKTKDYLIKTRVDCVFIVGFTVTRHNIFLSNTRDEGIALGYVDVYLIHV